jgi:putative phosphoesterase
MRIAVLADTHIPGRARDLPPTAWRIVEQADAVIHAGDVVTPWLLDRLRVRSPQVHAVLGNNDLPLRGALPETLQLDLGGTKIAVVHDSGPSDGRRRRLRRMFPDARAVIFGHSHIPICDDDGDLLLLNPGSPTDRRSRPSFTMATLECGNGTCSAALVDLGLERAG